MVSPWKVLRVRIKPPLLKKKKTAAERSRQWRENIKADEERYEAQKLKDRERNQKNRQLPVSDEEAQRRRERAKIRQQQCRARKAAKLAAEKGKGSPPKKPSTRATRHQEATAVEAQRQKWRMEKQKQRARWSAQKRRQHRLKSLNHYYKKKAEPSIGDEADCTDIQDPSTARPGKEGLRKAVYRAKKAVHKVHSDMNYTLPEDDTQEVCCHKKRGFFLVKSEEVDRSVDSSVLHTLKGTMQLHSVRGLGRNNLLQTRKLSCFCSACLDGQVGCKHSAFVDDWKDDQLRFKGTPPAAAAAAESAGRPAPSPELSPSGQPSPPAANAPTLDAAASSPPLPPSEPEIKKSAFFRRIHAEFRRCKTFAELQDLVARYLTDIERYPLPPIQQRTVEGVGGRVDRHALTLRPDTAPAQFFPLLTGSDGNCLPRCLSVFAYGKEAFHQEMRCRLVVELVKNFDLYAGGQGMAKEGETPQKIVGLLAVVAENSGTTPDTVTPEEIRAALSAEIMQVRLMSGYCGLWQIAAAANVLGATVCSVYPDKGWQVYVDLNNRTFSSASPSPVTCHIMWSTNRDELEEEHWTSNHFVSLLPQCPSA